jgi:hypothetical protein
VAKSSSGDQIVTISAFRGLRSDASSNSLSAEDSPSLQDVAFGPRSVFTREALVKMLAFAPPNPLVWHQAFTAKDGTDVIVAMDAKGLFWRVQGNQLVQIGATVPGAQVSSVAANGRLYMAISDGHRGVDIPRQYDGTTGNFDRVSQGGPAQGPKLSNFSIAASTLGSTSVSSSVAIATWSTEGQEQIQSPGQPYQSQPYGRYVPDPDYNPYTTVWTQLAIATVSAHGLVAAGENVLLAGVGPFSGAQVVGAITDDTSFTVGIYATAASSGTSGTVAGTANVTLQRGAGTVTAYTQSPHLLKPGYQFALSNVSPMAIGGGLASIVIDSLNLPGLATVTTESVHGLVPGANVAINSVQPVLVGTSIVSIVINGGIATLTTQTAHGVSIGAQVLVQTSSGPVLPFTVYLVISDTVFTYLEDVNDHTYTGGTVQLLWPASSDVSQNTFEVQETPSPTTFTVPIDYVSGTWTTGTITFAWTGTFFVIATPTDSSLTYAHPGPNAQSTDAGTVTPKGQISPGVHQCVDIFLTRTGALTAPSPPVTITANGGEYLLAEDLALPPSNIIAHWLAFTGANGGKFFVLPVPALFNGNPISTSTVIKDATSTSAILDFSDQSLLSGQGIDIPGNNLFAQVVLEPCLAVTSFANRLAWWGRRNTVLNYLNTGFEGGVLAGAPNEPLGWSVDGDGGSLVQGDFGLAWQIMGPGTGQISQSAYQDWEGVAILEPDTLYSFRFWSRGSANAGTITANLYGNGGIMAQATISATLAAGRDVIPQFWEATFNAKTPDVIPSDARLQVLVEGLPARRVCGFG